MAVADTPRWKYVLTDMVGNTNASGGEVLFANTRTYNDQLNGAAVASIVLNSDHPRLPWVLNNDALLKVYRRDRLNNWNLLLTGDVISSEEIGSGSVGQVTLTASSPFWRLGKRLLGLSVNAQNQGIGYSVGTPTTPVDISTIIASILSVLNGSGTLTGLQSGTVTLCGTTSVLGPIYSTFAGPVIQQLCATLGGPDIYITPLEPSGSMPNTVLGQLNVVPVRGTTKPNAIFEYGVGKFNVQSYDRLKTKQNVANTIYAMAPGWPTSVATGDQASGNFDGASINAIGQFDDLLQTDVASLTLRGILVNENLAVRKQAQQTITFVPTVDNPIDFGVDYGVGDVVTARAYEGGRFRYNGTARVYGVAFDISDNDAETVALTLVPGG